MTSHPSEGWRMDSVKGDEPTLGRVTKEPRIGGAERDWWRNSQLPVTHVDCLFRISHFTRLPPGVHVSYQYAVLPPGMAMSIFIDFLCFSVTAKNCGEFGYKSLIFKPAYHVVGISVYCIVIFRVKIHWRITVADRISAVSNVYTENRDVITRDNVA